MKSHLSRRQVLSAILAAPAYTIAPLSMPLSYPWLRPGERILYATEAGFLIAFDDPKPLGEQEP